MSTSSPSPDPVAADDSAGPPSSPPSAPAVPDGDPQPAVRRSDDSADEPAGVSDDRVADEPAARAGGEPTAASPAADAAAADPADDGLPADVEPVHRIDEVAHPSRIRRAPRYGRFAFVGFLVGVVLSLALTYLPVTGGQLGRRDLFFLLLLALGSAGTFLGWACALVADRRSLPRRARGRR